MKITIDFIDESSSRLYTCDAIRNFVGPRSDSWYCDLGGSCSGHLRRVGLFLIVYHLHFGVIAKERQTVFKTSLSSQPRWSYDAFPKNVIRFGQQRTPRDFLHT
jgi:hypothetical protein